MASHDVTWPEAGGGEGEVSETKLKSVLPRGIWNDDCTNQSAAFVRLL